jgi:hypothetical protein
MDQKAITEFVTGLCRRSPGLPIDLKLAEAIKGNDSKAIFNILMEQFSYQGISDRVAKSYRDKHGNVSYQDVTEALSKREPPCPKMRSFNTFKNCGYQKNKHTCNRPDFYNDCPLPKHPLRNGRLNQAAYSFYLFLKDECEGDLVAFIDNYLECHNGDTNNADIEKLRDKLVEKLSEVYGISDKVIHMVFSEFLMAEPAKITWVKVGRRMIAIDTLVHSMLDRTGILEYYGSDHNYGSACYRRKNSCFTVLEQISKLIDCRQFQNASPRGPGESYFPRFVQHSIWRYSAEREENICNERQVGKTGRCPKKACSFYKECKHNVST